MDKELEKDFLEMIDAHERVIYKVCYFSAKNHDELDDLFQETVLIVNRQALRDLIRKSAEEDADSLSLPEPGVEEHMGDGELLGDGG